jgi:hypothetical protein
MMKSRRMGRAGNVARMGKRGTHIGYLCESQKERHYQESEDVGGRIILRLILVR